MIKSIFARPVFINPLAYLTIPELVLIHRCIPYDFSSSKYIFLVITTGTIEGKLLKAGKEYILHLDMYTVDGICVLGEFYINSNTIDVNNFEISQSNGMVTIDFGDVTDVYLKLDIGKLDINKLK